MKSLLALLALCALALACPAADRPALENDIREAVFRHLFTSYPQPGARTYFLSIFDAQKRRGTDPDSALLARFASHSPRVAAASGAATDGQYNYIDPRTNKPAVIWEVRAIKWISNESVEVIAGYCSGARSAASLTYCLKLQDGAWVIDQARQDAISALPASTPHA